MERQQENALKIAHWLQESCPKAFVRSVLYAGLPTHLDYDMHMAQASGAITKADIHFVWKPLYSSSHIQLSIIAFTHTVIHSLW